MHAQQGSRLPARSRWVAGGLAAGMVLLGLSACDGATTAALSAASTGALHDRVQAVRAAADNHDRAAAIAAVDEFRAEVWRLTETGELNRADAAALLAHADAVAADVLGEVVTPEPTPTPTPEPTVTPSPTPDPAPVVAPAENSQTLQRETADKLTEMLRERLGEYVKQRMEEKKAEEKAERQKRRAEREKRKGKGGHDED